MISGDIFKYKTPPRAFRWQEVFHGWPANRTGLRSLWSARSDTVAYAGFMSREDPNERYSRLATYKQHTCATLLFLPLSGRIKPVVYIFQIKSLFLSLTWRVDNTTCITLALYHLEKIIWDATWHVVRPAKTQISLSTRPVWSESSLCTQWVAKGPSFLHADSVDSDQTGRLPRLIWVFAGGTYFVGFVTRWLNIILVCDFNSIKCMLHYTLLLFVFVSDKLTNLMDFCERIKTLYWPDWDERVTGSPQWSMPGCSE